MADIVVAKPFMLLHQNGDRQHFAAGAHTVAEDVASHWYVREHLAPASDDKAGESAPEPAQGAGEGDGGPGAGASEPAPDDKAALIDRAKALGLTVDGRWTADKIATAIAEAEAARA